MNPFKSIWRRIHSLGRRQGVKREIDEELRFHIEQRTAENVAAGMPPEEAERQARKRFGNFQTAREQCREERAANFGETLVRDLAFGVRMLSKNPGFSAVAVFTLALGIGATTAIFSAVYGVLINPYPYARPGEIWAPGVASAQDSQAMRPYRQDEFEEISKLPEFSETMGTTPGNVLLTGEFAPETITAPRVSLNAFQFLEVPPVLGRVFGPGDVGPGGFPQPVTVVSYRLWQRLLDGDPKAIGRALRLDDQLYTIIGVMPPRFGWWTSDGLWLPADNKPGDPGRVFPISRLKHGVNPSVARQHLHILQLQLAKANPAGFPNERFETLLTNYLDMTVASGTMQRALRVLFIAVGFLLFIACANVASLQLSRSSTRAREMAIRLSVGAGRGRLVRQLLTESVLLSVLGGALGLIMATGLTRMLVLLMPGFYVPNEARIEMNGYVLLFCMAVSVLTGIAFGLAPALQSSRTDLTDALKDEGRSAGSARGSRFRAGLVVAEVAISVVLLITAGLTTRSFIALENLDPGFHAEHVVTIDFTLPAARYSTMSQRSQFCAQLLERVQHLPGVEAVELGNGGLPFGGPQTAYSIEGKSGGELLPMINLVSADYLKTMGIPLLRGRRLAQQDILRSEPLAVINEAAAKLWPAGEDPIGRQIHVDLLQQSGGGILFSSNTSPDLTVIGVCANVRNDGLTSAPRPALLIPYTLVAPPDRTLAVRALGNPVALMNAVREQAKLMDPQLPLRNERTIQQALEDFTVQPRFTMVLFSLFGVFGLGLATVGIYGVLSYSVTQRTREIGVRMALGAEQWDVLGLILRNGGQLAGLGILLGGLASLPAARVVASQIELFNVSPIDLVSFFAVILLLSVVSAAACWLPARRAARVDPMVALRHE
jgi:putative ABC transport system permease protein